MAGTHGSEVRTLRSQMRDLVALGELRAVSIGMDSQAIAEAFADALLCALDLVMVSLVAPPDSQRVRLLRSVDALDGQASRALHEALEPLTTAPVKSGVSSIPDPVLPGTLHVIVLPVGRDGAVVAAARRADFPDDFQRALLVHASAQLEIVLRERELLERDRAEFALKRSEELFHSAFTHASVGMAVLAPDGRYLHVNSALCSITGYGEEELLGRRAEDLVPGFDELVRRLLAQGRFVVEKPILRKDGNVSTVRMSVSVIRDEAGAPLRVVSIVEDVTDRVDLFARERSARAAAEVALARLRSIETITDAALSNLGVDGLLRELLARLRTALSADAVAVLLLDTEGKELAARAVDGFPAEALDMTRLLAETMATVVSERRPEIVDRFDLSGLRDAGPSLLGQMAEASGVVVPLVVEGRAIGALVLASSRPRTFAADDVDLLQLVADRAAPAIERERLLESAGASSRRLTTLSRQLLVAQEQERRRVAVELHDELGQVLTAVKIRLESLERLRDPAAGRADLAEAIEAVERATGSVRDLALELRPSMLDDLGLAAALRWYVDRTASQAGLEAHVELSEVADLAPELPIACFRVAQEALTNVVRHARARRVWVSLRRSDDAIELDVRDDGEGFDVAAARDRALAGGTLRFESERGRGSEVRARFPLHAGEGEARA